MKATQLLLARPDGLQKPGGDRVQAMETQKALEAQGLKTTFADWTPSWGPAGIEHLHIFNVDRPTLYLAILRKLPPSCSFSVSTIHHSQQSVRLMRELAARHGMTGHLKSRLPQWLLDVGLMGKTWGLRATGPSLAEAKNSSKLWKAVGESLDMATFVHVLAAGELESLRHDTGWRGDNAIVVPNGVDLPSGGANHAVTEVGRVLVLGRIEPRKRQLEVAQAAASLGVAVDFVGATDPTSHGYFQRFQKALGPLCRYLGPVQPAERFQVVQRYPVLLNASLLEVLSLVDFEAAACGCHVVSTGAGYSREYLPRQQYHQFGTADLHAAVGLAAALAEQEPALAAYIPPTWQDVAATLGAKLRGSVPRE